MARKPDAKRSRLGVRLHEETAARLSKRHVVEASSARKTPSRSLSETTELLLLFALDEMPMGWRP